jgi:hypothetical protein
MMCDGTNCTNESTMTKCGSRFCDKCWSDFARRWFSDMSNERMKPSTSMVMATRPKEFHGKVNWG